ncbi:hypothetical protein ACJIZ3_016714 [Penstemon smallii]|uniref:Uncharacterized protein n=1 Tax=Penstemon smallii TaxID=265156 RepID=A0ABD3STG9_9LAMI
MKITSASNCQINGYFEIIKKHYKSSSSIEIPHKPCEFHKSAHKILRVLARGFIQTESLHSIMCPKKILPPDLMAENLKEILFRNTHGELYQAKGNNRHMNYEQNFQTSQIPQLRNKHYQHSAVNT